MQSRKVSQGLIKTISTLPFPVIFYRKEIVRCPLAEQPLFIFGHRDKMRFREDDHFLLQGDFLE